MRKALKSILFIAIVTLSIVGCSRKKDSFLSRNFHAVTAEYNTLFNGYTALEKGRQSLIDTYQDNYWDILPVERMEVKEVIILPGKSQNQDFNRAEEKAVKAIQRHGMNIKGKEKNPQIDEAYLLLGKSRYFDQRFVPALEALNYILYKYPASDKINQAKVWREKTNMRLENDLLAIKNLKRLLEQEELEDQDLADATSILAQAYVNTKHLDSALTQIDIAAGATKRSDEKGRYRFIQGQLYNKLQDKDSANIAFDRVIELNRKIPRIYLISAHMEKAKNFDYSNGDKLAFLELLTELEENRENRPFLDKIYHQIAEYHLKNDSDTLAIAYYNKSLRTDSPDKILMAKNYEILGDYYFDSNKYKTAGAYYDSTMTNMVENSKPFRTIKRKRENLEDVILYEGIAETNDSILNLVRMPEADRLAYFEEYIAKIKAEDEAEKLRQEIAERNKGLATANNQNTSSNIVNPRGAPNPSYQFYFYTPTTVAYGKNEFLKTWGDRELADNWRWSKKGSNSGASNTAIGSAAVEAVTDDQRYDPEFYLSKIPSEEKAIDSLSKDRNFAYYQLGLIYKEKFKEYVLSKDKFQELLRSDPEEKLILPSKYNLYKLYDLLGSNDEATIAKNEIISNYPDSRYASILSNPELAAEKDESSPESLFEKAFKLFEKQEYEAVISNSEKYIKLFDGEDIVPKFELLKARAKGRLYGFEAYVEAMNYVGLTYANTPEGLQAQNTMRVSKSFESKEFVDEVKSAKVVFQFSKQSETEMNEFVKLLEEVVPRAQVSNLSTSIDVYNPEIVFVVVHGLRRVEGVNGANGFTQLLSLQDKYKITRPFFAISTENYKTIQIHKNLEDYLTNQ